MSTATFASVSTLSPVAFWPCCGMGPCAAGMISSSPGARAPPSPLNIPARRSGNGAPAPAPWRSDLVGPLSDPLQELRKLQQQAQHPPDYRAEFGKPLAPLLVASDIAVLFGVIGMSSLPAAIAALPVALWEFSLGVWLVVKGFNPSPILSSDVRDAD